MSIKERLQRRLAEKKKAAGISSEAAAPPTNSEELKRPAWDNSVSKAVLDAAENSCRSLVEELMPVHYEEFLDVPNWSLHRKLTAISLSPNRQFERLWREMVERYDLQKYHRTKFDQVKLAIFWHQANSPNSSLSELSRQLVIVTKVEFERLPVSDRLLAAILARLATIDCFSVGAVCRRWHFVGRCAWNTMFYFELLENVLDCPKMSTTEAALRPSKLLYRACLLTTLVFAGDLDIHVESLTLGYQCASVSTIVLVGVRFVSRQMSAAGINDKVLGFIKEAVYLEEFVMVDVEVCAINCLRNRRELRSLDFRLTLSETHNKKLGRKYFHHLMLTLDVFHRQNKASFAKFCQDLRKLQLKQVIFSGSTSSNLSVGLPEEIFVFCFAELMPHLRELSLCNVSFGDGTYLQVSSLDLLSEKILRDSKLELFCLTNGEISARALTNFRNLQIIILLRCRITPADRELRLMAGWHPNANLPGSLITDDVTAPRWFKPTYFRVVRIMNFSEFKQPRFVKLRKRWCTVSALLKSCLLEMPDFCYSSEPEHEAEDVLVDSYWLQ